MKVLLYNANVITMDKNNNIFNCIRYEDNVITFVGDFLELKEDDIKDDIKINLENRTVLPGFIDSHIHLINVGYTEDMVNLINSTSINELIYKGNLFLCENDLRNTWLIGRGWNESLFNSKRLLTKFDLDKISTNIPIIYVRACGHIACLNSKALELTNLHLQVDNFPKLIDVDMLNNLTGIVRESALSYVYEFLPSPEISEIKKIIKKSIFKLNRYGITSVHSDDFECFSDKDYQKIISAYTDLEKDNSLNIRVYQQCLLPTEDKINSFVKKKYHTGYGSNKYKIGPIKLLQDGSLGGQTALLSYNYINSTHNGTEIYTQDELNSLIDLANKNNFETAIHGIGDLAIKMIMNKYKNESKINSIVHFQITDSKILNDLKKHKVNILAQPFFINADMDFIYDRIKASKIKYTYNWKTVYDINPDLLSFGSDAPVDSYNVFYGLHCAINRTNINNMPESGFIKEQSLSLFEALRCYTINGAKLSNEDNIKGSLEIGKLADISVIDGNIQEIPLTDIKDLSILYTILDGKLVYKKSL